MTADEQRRETLESWFRTWGDAVLHTCFLALGDRHLAEDAMQETFVKAWRGMERFEGRRGASVKTWLLRIAYNTCMDMRRSPWFRHVDLSVALDELPPGLLQTDGTSHQLFLDVLCLPDPCRDAVMMHIYHRLTLKETAHVLGVGQITVIRQLEKAYALLGAEEGRH